jgi:predicted ester cyclase
VTRNDLADTYRDYIACLNRHKICEVWSVIDKAAIEAQIQPR